ncbi:unnamed protein product [Rotaria magnacalcarata]|uniref:Vacuolar protein sorting-associated protein 45 n=1 Tax=Rotaria magnacalcarata TaxID=392030 RepID=A0A819HBW9_9BILA|nr:unnamed protein product [Rotaria magnacalcarata]CAF1462147.1 unnamed protein product [Rotaria magnacalcarata]CAF1927234.1 unnamed protein product [Rotaria magnacalcarata]CAF1983433.1 unnamed protein product [Rotaria magnacalcarata]CAF2086281.1 unnamed protein product [Rotaria magnacalcarata]
MTNINLIEAVRSYINRMIEDCGPTIKGLVMDKETASIVSMVYAQSEILQKEVFLFERIDIPGQKSLKHLTAICFLRPTEENIQSLVRELHDPKYGSYFIYFTNFVELNDIKSLAEADEFECVRVVQEYYADYLAINPHLYSLNIPSTYQKNYEWNDNLLRRTVQGLVSVLLALRKKSATIRYQKSSNMSRTLADKLSSTLKRQVDFTASNPNDINQTIVLIIDRREDAITPLLNQWTYQAMVHELIGIKNNRVSLSHVPDITKELEEVIMNAEYDEFYANNLYSNFGEIATNIKVLMEHFQEKHKSQSKIESIGDMKTFIENYPQFKKLSGTVSKHVTIVSELSRLVGLYNLLEVSETEQHLVCQGDHNDVVQKIKRLIKNDKVRDLDILRLLALYALRYERHASNELNTLKYEAQKHRKLPEKYIQFIQALLEYGGLKFRQADLFNTQTPMAITRQFIRGLRGVDNVYAQHVPLIKDLIDQLLRGKLKDTSYPNVNAKDQVNQQSSSQLQGQIIKPSEIIVYVIGGVTYEESYHIQQMNKQSARIIVGGSYMHNFPSFIDEVLFAAPSSLSAASTELLSSKRR